MGGRLPSGASVALYERLDSTSLEAKRRAEAGARGPAWIVAIEQTGGYGRRGSVWEQAAGDLAATFLFDPQTERDRFGQFSFVASLAVADALRRLAPRLPLSLKWPNDVLVEDGKIAGILLELIEARGGPLIALGIGVNVVSKPSVADYPAARLLDWVDEAPPPQDFVRLLDEVFAAWRVQWRRHGFAPIRAAWLKEAARKGKKVRVRLPGETIEGTFMDLDSSGALVLECDGARRLIAAGAILRN